MKNRLISIILLVVLASASTCDVMYAVEDHCYSLYNPREQTRQLAELERMKSKQATTIQTLEAEIMKLKETELAEMASLKKEIDILQAKETALTSRLEEATGKKVRYHTNFSTSREKPKK
jgi:hypothetical protein